MKNFKTKSKQTGATLVIGIVLLLIISIIGTTSMKSALLQEKMAGGLTRKAYADAAAYSLLVSVENHLFKLYENNNGIENLNCDYCGTDARDDEWHDFITGRNMVDGEEYPGNTNLIVNIAAHLKDNPRYVLYPAKSETSSISSYSETVGETDGGAAGGTGGNLGSENESSKLEFFRIATKANDAKGHLYVLYESVYAVMRN